MVPSFASRNCCVLDAEQACNDTRDCALTSTTPRHLSIVRANRKVKSRGVCGLSRVAACIACIVCAMEATLRPNRAAAAHSSKTADARKHVFV